LKARYRSGFFGVSDKLLAEKKQTPQQQIYNALTSPFGANDISLNPNTLFADDAQTGSFIRSLVNTDAKNLKFTEEADGTRKANFDIIAMTLGDNGAAIDQITKNYTIRVGEKSYQKILEKGFTYNLLVPIKKPGAYQFRVALRDSATEKVVSASQFIEVSNLKKGNLALSDIVLGNYTTEEWRKISLGQNQTSNNEGEVSMDTSLRRFKRGTVLRYDYLVYNAKTNPTQLQVQDKLYRDDQLVVEGKPSPLDTNGQTDVKPIQGVGAFTLETGLKPGNYVL